MTIEYRTEKHRKRVIIGEMTSIFTVDEAPVDPLFGLVARYKEDTFPHKVDLSIGAYRDENAKPWILPIVKKVNKLMAEDPKLDNEYLPIAGLSEFTKAGAKLVLGNDCKAIEDDRVVSVQTISGTGANHLAGLFLSRYPPYGIKDASIFIPNPTWANHRAIFENVGLTVKTYPYFDAETSGLDFEGLMKTLNTEAKQGDIILLHACAHNPTGVDPNHEQWKQIGEIVKSRKLFAFFDGAYQGFASGDLDADAWSVRHFMTLDIELLVCQSFSKNFGLYGQRAGALHVVASNQTTKKHIASQLSKFQRSEISNPPAYGARIVAKTLNDPVLFNEWKQDLKTMANRINDMREVLKTKLQDEYKTPGTWNHIVDQIGMFSFTGLTPPQVDRLIEEFHIYLSRNGRISMAGLNKNNVDYVAKAIDTVVRETK